MLLESCETTVGGVFDLVDHSSFLVDKVWRGIDALITIAPDSTTGTGNLPPHEEDDGVFRVAEE